MPSLASLPERKQKYVRNRVKGMSRAVAARNAGYAPSTAVAAATRIESPDVKEVFRKLVQQALPPKAIVDTLQAGLAAVDTRIATFNGKITDTLEVPDYGQRRAYLELASEYAGYVMKDQPAQQHLHVIGTLTRVVPNVATPSVAPGSTDK